MLVDDRASVRSAGAQIMLEAVECYKSGWRPREWCMAPSDMFITFSQLSVGLPVWRCGLFRLR